MYSNSNEDLFSYIFGALSICLVSLLNFNSSMYIDIDHACNEYAAFKYKLKWKNVEIQGKTK